MVGSASPAWKSYARLAGALGRLCQVRPVFDAAPQQRRGAIAVLSDLEVSWLRGPRALLLRKAASAAPPVSASYIASPKLSSRICQRVFMPPLTVAASPDSRKPWKLADFPLQ